MYTVFGVIGLLIISYSIWVRKERRQDVLFVLGGLFLLVYSASKRDPVFIVLQVVFIISALVELLRISKKKAR